MVHIPCISLDMSFKFLVAVQLSLQKKLAQLHAVDMQKLPGSFCCCSNLSPRVILPSFDAHSLCILHSDCAKTSKYANRWILDVFSGGLIMSFSSVSNNKLFFQNSVHTCYFITSATQALLTGCNGINQTCAHILLPHSCNLGITRYNEMIPNYENIFFILMKYFQKFESCHYTQGGKLQLNHYWSPPQNTYQHLNNLKLILFQLKGYNSNQYFLYTDTLNLHKSDYSQDAGVWKSSLIIWMPALPMWAEVESGMTCYGSGHQQLLRGYNSGRLWGTGEGAVFHDLGFFLLREIIHFQKTNKTCKNDFQNLRKLWYLLLLLILIAAQSQERGAERARRTWGCFLCRKRNKYECCENGKLLFLVDRKK
ncbi:putative signal peptide protein [Puccinia sorghi]|uniref:Putative signal peptide protein n=1 Tax=Puccinia sorghi TaxID=27349 RepID=A0A0L6V3S7_9BASI|nr:putative signal peptide protein [Puccinia sorghi]